MRRSFRKTAIFHFWTKAMLLLKPFMPRILLHLKQTKKATLNGCISKDRVNSESKLKFSESSFNFLEYRVVFCTLYSRQYTTVFLNTEWFFARSTHVNTQQGAPMPTTPDAAASGSQGSKS